ARSITIACLVALTIISEALPASASSLNSLNQSNGQTAAPPQEHTSGATHSLIVSAVDENGVPVPGAHVSIIGTTTQVSLKGETNYGGRREFNDLAPGNYRIQVDKEGFYTATQDEIQIPAVERVDLTLNHVQEFAETVNVTYSPPAIDLSETAKTDTHTSREIINIPYTTSRDVRGLVAFNPGVVQDPFGNLHFNGSGADQVLTQLDGFNITHPINGSLETRVSVDALRAIQVKSSRYSAEYGKGSGGVLGLETGMGDDRFRFLATNFIPSFQNAHGVAFDSWTPRITLSGPLVRKRAWFFEAVDMEYNLDVVRELPLGADRNQVWRVSNLAKAQVNVSESNIVTGSFLINAFHADHVGLTALNPVETTLKANRTGYLGSIKDQSYLPGGAVLDLGFAVNQFHVDETPRGDLPFVISPEGTRGSFPELQSNDSRRTQFVATLFLPRVERRGTHELKLGFDGNLIDYDQFSDRRPFTVLREDGTRSREVSFDRPVRFERDNFEASGFAQDRWSIANRIVLELGLRLDWDQIVRKALWSPRFAASWLVTRDGETKLTAGAGLYYDATSLATITRPLFGRRFDTVYGDDGQTVIERTETRFTQNEKRLDAPRYQNFTVSMERRLPRSIYASVNLNRKTGQHGFTFVDRVDPATGEPTGVFELQNQRRDRYYAAEVTLRKTSKDYSLFGSYVRSSATSNAVVDFSFGDPVFNEQGSGPLPWDAPNRLISWGWSPPLKGFTLFYSLEWRDGYPFSVVDRNQMLVGAPNSMRFPDYFSLNLHAEKRVRVFGNQFALRAGFNNITNHVNATAVNNNIDSPMFLTLSGVQDRSFTTRIRFLGRK
ncbi:MAG TPA: TonB-dependent receptor, partial [Blastocatellia bacterium]|nr:TonB-dependent receptor [Blastocatellia bacterium]